MNYFAYGSNLCTNRLRRRNVSSAVFVAIGSLPEYILRFHKRSNDGSGKCNAFYTGKEADKVIGVIYEIDPVEKKWLDDAEGLDRGYQEDVVDIRTQEAALRCFTYIAEGSYIDDSLKPYDWYHDIVVAGAREQNLPKSYIQATILSVESVPDADVQRDTRERRCLAGS